MDQPQELDMMTRSQTGSVLWKLAGAEAIQLQADQLINLLKAALHILLLCLIIFGLLMAMILVPMTVILVVLVFVVVVVVLVCSTDLVAFVVLVGPIPILVLISLVYTDLLLLNWIGYQTQQANQQLQNLPGPDGDIL